MKKVFFLISAIIGFSAANAQLDAGSLFGMPSGTTTEMNNITNASVGSCMYNTTERKIYFYTGSAWVSPSDDQTSVEVLADAPVDVDGDGDTESTVEAVIQDIAPITSASGRIFYPPSIAIDASTNGTGRTVDLYQEYINQYAPTGPFATTFVSSAGAPAIPTYSRSELYYYVTFYDAAVFDNISIDANGNMTYDIVGQPADYNSLINVVFVVK